MAEGTVPIVFTKDSEESFVIHFGSELPRINAYTLASTLVALANAAKAANASVNPGLDIEIVVEALGSGSFKAKIRALYRSGNNLFSPASIATNIALSIIAAYIYQVTLAPDQSVQVIVNTDEVVIQQGDKKVVVPRKVHDAMREAEKSPDFRQGVSEMFQAVDRDEAIDSLGIAEKMEDREPALEVPRERFPDAVKAAAMDARRDDVRDVVEPADVQIIRAILERKKRRWEFAWRGIRISAPITDDAFNAQFLARKIPLHPGDGLEVLLKMRRYRDSLSGVVVNDPNGYEIVKVVKHVPGQSQTEISP